MRLVRLAAYGAVGALMAIPSLLLLSVTAGGLALSVVLVGLPLLLGGLVMTSFVAQLDRWLVHRLLGLHVEDPDPRTSWHPWSRSTLVRLARDTTFVIARTAVGLVCVALLAVAAVAAVAGVGAFVVDGFLTTGRWQSTAGVTSWWGPPLALAATGTAAGVLVTSGVLQNTLASLLGPTESRRLERARHHQTLVEERARLAADLHDAVGHSLTVTTLQAAAAARVVRTDPEFVEEALGRIETDSRRALGEVDRALALLTSGTASILFDTERLYRKLYQDMLDDLHPLLTPEDQ